MAVRRSGVWHVRFLGEDFWIVEGAITKPEDYRAGLASYAHLFPDGRVRRYQAELGGADDIEWLGEVADPEAGIDEAEWFKNWRDDPAWKHRPDEEGAL